MTRRGPAGFLMHGPLAGSFTRRPGGPTAATDEVLVWTRGVLVRGYERGVRVCATQGKAFAVAVGGRRGHVAELRRLRLELRHAHVPQLHRLQAPREPVPQVPAPRHTNSHVHAHRHCALSRTHERPLALPPPLTQPLSAPLPPPAPSRYTASLLSLPICRRPRLGGAGPAGRAALCLPGHPSRAPKPPAGDIPPFCTRRRRRTEHAKAATRAHARARVPAAIRGHDEVVFGLGYPAGPQVLLQRKRPPPGGRGLASGAGGEGVN